MTNHTRDWSVDPWKRYAEEHGLEHEPSSCPGCSPMCPDPEPCEEKYLVPHAQYPRCQKGVHSEVADQILRDNPDLDHNRPIGNCQVSEYRLPCSSKHVPGQPTGYLQLVRSPYDYNSMCVRGSVRMEELPKALEAVSRDALSIGQAFQSGSATGQPRSRYDEYVAESHKKTEPYKPHVDASHNACVPNTSPQLMYSPKTFATSYRGLKHTLGPGGFCFQNWRSYSVPPTSPSKNSSGNGVSMRSKFQQH